MTMNNSYNDVGGFDVPTMLQEVKDFDARISRDVLVSDEEHINSRKDVMLLDEEPIGIISQKRPDLSFTDIVTWANDEFSNIGTDYKLKESTFTKKGELYQEYIFDRDIPSPDGNGMSAMAIVRASYTGMPLHIQLGTYRYTCRNGVVVGETVGDIKVRASVGQDILKSSLKDELAVKFDRFQGVVEKYKEINDASMSVYLLDFLQAKYLPAMMRKTVMYMLRDEGSIELTVEKLKGEHLENAVDDLYSIVNDQSAFYLYNLMTQFATHESRSVNSRQNGYKSISKFFGI